MLQGIPAPPGLYIHWLEACAMMRSGPPNAVSRTLNTSGRIISAKGLYSSGCAKYTPSAEITGSTAIAISGCAAIGSSADVSSANRVIRLADPADTSSPPQRLPVNDRELPITPTTRVGELESNGAIAGLIFLHMCFDLPVWPLISPYYAFRVFGVFIPDVL